jgi:hypothetical protein
MPGYLRRLPYRRIVCLLLSASQLFPLPEPVEVRRTSPSHTWSRIIPDVAGALNNKGGSRAI